MSKKRFDKISSKSNNELILIKDPIYGDFFLRQSLAVKGMIGLIGICCIWIILLILYFSVGS